MSDGFRRCTAVVSMLLALVVFALDATIARAADAADAPPASVAPKTAATPSAKSAAPSRSPTINIEVDSKDAADATDDADKPAPPTNRSRHAKAHIQLGDREFDSFDQAMEAAPWFVGVLLMLLGILFLTPVILLVGIIWYKLRKTRLQNEAMLKLAERGVMPPAQAATAVVSGVAPPLPPDAPAPESGFAAVVAARRRAVWSDLRKGVIITAVGLSFVFYSMFESGSANWVGLLLMFVGIGYLLLWWLEDRHLRDREMAQSTGRGIGPT